MALGSISQDSWNIIFLVDIALVFVGFFYLAWEVGRNRKRIDEERAKIIKLCHRTTGINGELEKINQVLIHLASQRIKDILPPYREETNIV